MKILYSILLMSTLVSSIIYGQIESRDLLISSPKFLNEYKNTNQPHGFINDETLDSIINSNMQQYHLPGLTAMVVKYDSVVWSNNYGYFNIALNQLVEDSTLFLMASISKTIMVTAMMQLWEEGMFDLNDNINNYLQPQFQVVNPYFPNDTITIKMLMTHTSSINDNWNILVPVVSCGDSPIQLDSFLVNYFTPGGIYYSPANFNNYSPYGNYWDYSNAGSCILAYLVEKLSGIPFDQYCREKIFDPLDMNETSWFLDGLDTTNIATPYEWISNQYSANCHQGWPLYPVAFLRTNKIDLLKFLTTYMHYGKYNGNTILDSTTISIMLSDQMGHPDPSGDYQGLIWYKTFYDGRWLWGHTGGWIYGTATAMFFVPEEDWGLIFFTNIFPDIQALYNIFYAICDYAIEWGVPVELTSFTASTLKNNVTLNWTTATEINNQGFEVQRNFGNSEFVTVGFVEGHGTTTEEHHYSYKDKDVSGFLRYRLKQVNYDGSFEYSDIVEAEVLGNISYELAQNYPNPFNPNTNISYTVPTESQVKLSIYNPLGELVETIVNEKQSAGKYDVVWNAGNHPSGVYIYTLDAVSVNGNEQKKISKKMILLK